MVLPEVRLDAGAEQAEHRMGESCFGVRRVQPRDECGEQDRGQFRRGVTRWGGRFEAEMAARRVDEGPVGGGDDPVRCRVGGGDEFAGGVGDGSGRHEQYEVPLHLGDVVPPVHRAGGIHTADRSWRGWRRKSTVTEPRPASTTARTWKSARCVPPSFSSRRRPNVIVSTEAAPRPGAGRSSAGSRSRVQFSPSRDRSRRCPVRVRGVRWTHGAAAPGIEREEPS